MKLFDYIPDFRDLNHFLSFEEHRLEQIKTQDEQFLFLKNNVHHCPQTISLFLLNYREYTSCLEKKLLNGTLLEKPHIAKINMEKINKIHTKLDCIYINNKGNDFCEYITHKSFFL